MHIKPKAMLSAVRDMKNIQIPSKEQLDNFLRYYRSRIQDTKCSAMCLKDFDNFYETNSEVPDDPDKMFVSDVSTESLKEDGKVVLFFRIFLTTK